MKVKYDYKNDPFFTIWFFPRETYKKIISDKKNEFNTFFWLLGAYILFFIYLLIQILHFKDLQLQKILLMTLILLFVSMMYGALYLLFFSLLFYLGGKLFKGRGKFINVVKLVSLSLIPVLWIFIITIPEAIIIKDQVLKIFIETNDSIIKILHYVLLFIKLILFIWSLFILGVCISEEQKIGMFKTVFNIMLGYAIPILIIINYLFA